MDSLVCAEWLEDHLADDDLAVIDASRHLPGAGRDAAAEFEAAHIPGARFLDLASLVDGASHVPSAIPSAAQLAQRLSAIGVAPDMRIVIYDDSAVKTSSRAWFILKSLGRKNVALLDGGLENWRREGRPLSSGVSAALPIAANGPLDPPLDPAPKSNNRVAAKAEMIANIQSKSEQVIDARSAERVFGTGIDPVHGGQNGRIPGALNLPFGHVFAEDGRFKSPSQLRAAFTQAGADLDAPVIATCGSGVTACVLLFALELAGKHDTRLYDGSWQEWEADPETPKEQGAP